MNTDGTFAGEGRPASPRAYTHTNSRNNRSLWKKEFPPVPSNYEIPMNWHHMMPWHQIRDLWDALVYSRRWDALESWLNLLPVDARSILDEMERDQPDLDKNTRDNLAEALCWATWNLVEGPDKRKDDPGEEFDAFKSLKFSRDVRNRSQTMHNVYTLVSNWHSQVYVHNREVSVEQAKSLIKWFKDLSKNMSKNTQIPMFEPRAWTVVDKGRIDQYGRVDRNKHPTWKKAA